MAVNMDRLSVWEIAHRWHDKDPHQSKTIEETPLEVKDTIRNLIAEIYYERLYSDLWLEREEETNQATIKALKKKKIRKALSDYKEELKACLTHNRIDINTLCEITVPYWELEYWCNENEIPFPNFWFKPLWKGGQQLPFLNASANPSQESANHQTKSSQHSEAAHARHEPTNVLKRECVEFYLTFDSISYAEAANKFYNQLDEAQRRLLSPTNAVDTLKRAISEYKNNKDRPWLKGFTPKTTQTTRRAPESM